MTTIALIAIICLLALACLFLLHRDYCRTIANLEARIAKLELIAPKRIPYKAADELLDAMAALTKEMAEQDFHRDLIMNAAGHITNALATGTKRE